MRVMIIPLPRDLAVLPQIERKVLWLATWTIHHANHVRAHADGLKGGGHQASCASLATIMTVLYFHTLRSQDRVAVKPHASPNFHAIQYLLGRQTQARLEAFRGYRGAQSYPSRTKDAVLVARPGLRARPWLGPRPARRADDRSRRRCRARRGQYLRSDAGGLEAG